MHSNRRTISDINLFKSLDASVKWGRCERRIFTVRLIVWRHQRKCLMKTKHTHNKWLLLQFCACGTPKSERTKSKMHILIGAHRSSTSSYGKNEVLSRHCFTLLEYMLNLWTDAERPYAKNCKRHHLEMDSFKR